MLGIILVIGTGVVINLLHLVGADAFFKQSGAFLILAACCVATFIKRGRIAFNLPVLLAWAFVVVGIFILGVQEVIFGNSDFARRIVGVIFPVAVCALILSLPRERIQVRQSTALMLLLSALAVIGVGLAQWRTGQPLVWTGQDGGWQPWAWKSYDPTTGLQKIRGFSFFSTPVQYGYFCIAAALLPLAGMLRAARLQFYPLALTVLGALGVYASGNRTAILALLLGAVFMLVLALFPRLQRTAPALIVGVYLLVSGGLLAFPSALSEAADELQGGGRLLDPTNLLIRLTDAPYLLASYLDLPDQFVLGARNLPKLLTPTGLRSDNADVIPVDNELLYLLLQLGLPGLLLLALMYVLAKRLVRDWRQSRNPHALAALGFLMAWAVGAGFNVVYIYALPILSGLLLLRRVNVGVPVRTVIRQHRFRRVRLPRLILVKR